MIRPRSLGLRGLIPRLLLAGIVAAGPATAGEPCPHPRIVPLLEIGDLVGDADRAAESDVLTGDEVCELTCGIRVVIVRATPTSARRRTRSAPTRSATRWSARCGR